MSILDGGQSGPTEAEGEWSVKTYSRDNVVDKEWSAVHNADGITVCTTFSKEHALQIVRDHNAKSTPSYDAEALIEILLRTAKNAASYIRNNCEPNIAKWAIVIDRDVAYAEAKLKGAEPDFPQTAEELVDKLPKKI